MEDPTGPQCIRVLYAYCELLFVYIRHLSWTDNEDMQVALQEASRIHESHLRREMPLPIPLATK